MSLRHLACSAAAVAAIVGVSRTSFSGEVAKLGGGEYEVRLSGCLVRGDGDGAGYLLTNAPAEPAWLGSTDAQVAPNAVGTTGGFNSVFYWLHGSGDLKAHVGHRVEIEGELKGNLKEGEIRVERKDQWTEVEVKADGRTMKYNVPHTSVVPAPGREKEQKSDVLVRRIDVGKVRMVAASCTP